MRRRTDSRNRLKQRRAEIRDLAFSIFGLLFVSVFLGFGLGDIFRSLWFYTGVKVPCQMERFEIREDPKAESPFAPDLVFHYQWEGRSYTGTKLRRGGARDEHYEPLASVRAALLAQPGQYCRVNRSHPADAALLPDEWDDKSLFFVMFGLCIGTTLIISLRLQWRGIDPRETHQIEMAMPIFLLFAFLGGWLLFRGLVPNVIRLVEARSWHETSAVVKWSRVGMHRGTRSGTYYFPDICYSYRGANGAVYISSSHSIFPVRWGDRAENVKRVAAHPPGSAITCYVNPDRPWQAQLDRDLHWSCLFGLFAVPFLGIGIWGLVWCARHRRPKKTAR